MRLIVSIDYAEVMVTLDSVVSGNRCWKKGPFVGATECPHHTFVVVQLGRVDARGNWSARENFGHDRLARKDQVATERWVEGWDNKIRDEEG